MYTGDFHIGRVVGKEEDWSIIFVVWIENLGSRKAIPPGLTVSVQNSGTVNLDVPGMSLVYPKLEWYQVTYFPPHTQNVMLFWKS